MSADVLYRAVVVFLGGLGVLFPHLLISRLAHQLFESRKRILMSDPLNRGCSVTIAIRAFIRLIYGSNDQGLAALLSTFRGTAAFDPFPMSRESSRSLPEGFPSATEDSSHTFLDLSSVPIPKFLAVSFLYRSKTKDVYGKNFGTLTLSRAARILSGVGSLHSFGRNMARAC